MKKPPQDLSRLLHQPGHFPSLAEKAELLLYLDHYVKERLASPVAEQIKVANVRENRLIIEVSNGTWATRVNFQKANLLSQLRQETLPTLTAIEVKVNPRLASYTEKPKSSIENEARGLSPVAKGYIESLAAHTGGSLGEKLKRLAQGANRKKNS